MQDMLAERSRVRGAKNNGDRPPVEKAVKAVPSQNGSGGADGAGAGPDLAALVKSVKRKAEIGGLAGRNGDEGGVEKDGSGSGGKKRKRSRGKKGGAAAAEA